MSTPVDVARPEAFAPHFDGVFVRTPSEKSVYTLLVYLNSVKRFRGHTRFYNPARAHTRRLGVEGLGLRVES